MAKISFEKSGKKHFTVIEWTEEGKPMLKREPLGKFFADFCNIHSEKLPTPEELLEKILEDESNYDVLGEVLSEAIDRYYFNNNSINDCYYFKAYHDNFINAKTFFLNQKLGNKNKDEEFYLESIAILSPDFRSTSIIGININDLRASFRNVVFNFLFDTEGINHDHLINELIYSDSIEINDISISLSLSRCNKYQHTETYEYKDVRQALKLEYFEMTKQDIFIKPCKSCGKYFLFGPEQRRARKEYCDDFKCRQERSKKLYGEDKNLQELKRSRLEYSREKNEPRKKEIAAKIVELKDRRGNRKRGRKKIN